MFIKAFLLLCVTLQALAGTSDNSTSLNRSGALFAWTPWSQCQEGKRERSSFQKIKEVENCYGQGSKQTGQTTCKCATVCRFSVFSGAFTLKPVFSVFDCSEIYTTGIKEPEVYNINLRPGQVTLFFAHRTFVS